MLQTPILNSDVNFYEQHSSFFGKQCYFSRGSRPEVLRKKGVLRNFAKFTEKHLLQSLFLKIKLQAVPVTLLKKRL